MCVLGGLLNLNKPDYKIILCVCLYVGGIWPVWVVPVCVPCVSNCVIIRNKHIFLHFKGRFKTKCTIFSGLIWPVCIDLVCPVLETLTVSWLQWKRLLWHPKNLFFQNVRRNYFFFRTAPDSRITVQKEVVRGLSCLCLNHSVSQLCASFSSIERKYFWVNSSAGGAPLNVSILSRSSLKLLHF